MLPTSRLARPLVFVSLAALLVNVGCGQTGSSQQPTTATDRVFSGVYPLQIVCTTAQVADIVTHIAGAHAEVTSLMGPGVDPHLFKATPGDVGRLNRADIIFFSGMHLEGRLADLLVQMARRTPTFAVTEGLQNTADPRLREPAEFAGHYDPHVWHDVSLWADCVAYTAEQLSTFDPTHADDYRTGAQTYIDQLNELHAWSKSQMAQVPAGQRVLVTAHDAFGYFGAAYGIEVHGLQGISTADEADVAALNDIVNLLVGRKIKAVFVESSVSPRHIQAIVEACAALDHQVALGGELFSDAMGPPGTPEATYIGMIKHNVNTIVSALK